MLSFTSHSNCEAVLIKLFKHSEVKADIKTINAELDKHPDYPSMLAISDVLTVLGIENEAYYVDTADIAGISCPFIAHTNLDGGNFLLVTQITAEDVFVENEIWDGHRLSINEFKVMFEGVVLTAKAPAAVITAAPSLQMLLSRIKTPVIAAYILLTIVSALVYRQGSGAEWQLLLLSLFKSAGLVVSVLLLVQSFDSNNPLVQVLCKTNGKTNCNAILSSKAAKVFEGLSWSEVGFFYFAGTLLLLLFGGNNNAKWLVVTLLNFVSLPYTFYSIYYQAKVAKQWCVLCCAVQALLWLETIVLLVSLTSTGHALFNGSKVFAQYNPGQVLSTILICLLTPIILWILLKPVLLKLQELQPLKQQLRKFKYNAEIFNRLLTEQSQYAIPDEEWSIVLGNVEANNVITMATNPYCPPCAKTHQLLDELLTQNNNIQARIVFTAINTETDPKTPISRHLMALNELPDKTIVRRALHDWYTQKQKNYEAWAAAYPVQLNQAAYYKIDKQRAWCQTAEVTSTPTLLLNGYRLPEAYQLPDLKYMLY